MQLWGTKSNSHSRNYSKSRLPSPAVENTSLDESVQNFCGDEALPELQQNGEAINIYNKKHNEQMDYVLEVDPDEWRK